MNTETRDRTVFIRVDDEEPWTDDEVKEYLDDLRDLM